MLDTLSIEEKLEFLTEYPQRVIGEELYQRIRLAGALTNNKTRYNIRDQVYGEFIEKFRKGRAKRENEKEEMEREKERTGEEAEIEFVETEV